MTQPAAVLVAVQLPGVSDAEHEGSLAELRRLVRTLGHDVVATVSQKRTAFSQKTIIGQGKLIELAALTGGSGFVPSGAPEKKDKARQRRQQNNGEEETLTGNDSDGSDGSNGTDGNESAMVGHPQHENARTDDDDASDSHSDSGGVSDNMADRHDSDFRQATVVVVDHEISPSQARNLERATGAQVIDRTGVIVEIFHHHAKSREARLEVEIARLNYLAPRLREVGAGADRQRGGIGGKGAGESAVELDRRKIRDRIAELRHELEAIQRDGDTRRAQRGDELRVALVGYTNAGKSSLMRALTASDVLIADKLFATLDTTVRALHPESKPRILVSDTVGFIKKLPRDLVASFRSTLDEARDASLLLLVADAADPAFRSHLEVTRVVLAEIGADAVTPRLVLNKIDRLNANERAELTREFPEAILVCAKAPNDVARLREAIVAFFEAAMVEGEFVVPYVKQSFVSQLHDSVRVLSEDYDENGTKVRVLALPSELARLQALLAQ